MRKVSARRNIENALRRYGFVCVAGVDEVGRGCLAGPVMAGGVLPLAVVTAQELPLPVWL